MNLYFHLDLLKIMRDRERRFTYRSDEIEVEFIGTEQHIGAMIPVKHKFPITVGLQRHERQGGSGSGIEVDPLISDAVFPQDPSQHVAELVVAELSDERGSSAEAGDGDGDVGGSAAGGFEEARGFGEGDAGLGGDEVDEHLAEADDEWFLAGGCHQICWNDY